MSFEDLKTVRQVAELNPAFSENGIRWLIFNRERNGFAQVVVKLGGRVFLDINKLNEWVEKNQTRSA